MNYILKVSALVLLAGALFGCQSHSSQANQNAMIIAITDDNNGSKIDATTYSGTRVIHGALYEPLVEYDKGEIKPFLATKWDMSNDGQSYTFYLDERAVFNNNEPVLAKDVKFSLERSIHFDEKQSLEISRKLKSIEIDNDHQITLTFNEPATQILLELSQARPLRMMSGKAVEPAYAIDGEFKKEIGSGPWVFQEYKTGDFTRLSPNTHYWKESPASFDLIFKMISDPQARVLALQNGSVDIIGGEIAKIPMESLSLFQNDQFEIHQRQSTMSYFIVMNDLQPFVKDVAVRKAINYATNTKELYANNDEVTGLFSKNIRFINSENQPYYEYDLAKAKQTLEDDGYIYNENKAIYEKDGQSLQINLVIQVEEYPEWKQMAEAFQADMKAAGIGLEIKVLEQSAYYDALWDTREFDLLMYRTYTDAQLPYRFMTSLFYQTDSNNGIATSNPKFAELLDKIGLTADLKGQQSLFDDVFKLLYDEAVAVPVYYTSEVFATSKRIKNFTFDVIEDSPVKWHLLEIGE